MKGWTTELACESLRHDCNHTRGNLCPRHRLGRLSEAGLPMTKDLRIIQEPDPRPYSNFVRHIAVAADALDQEHSPSYQQQTKKSFLSSLKL